MLSSGMGCSLEGYESLNPNQIEQAERDHLEEISVHRCHILQTVTLRGPDRSAFNVGIFALVLYRDEFPLIDDV